MGENQIIKDLYTKVEVESEGHRRWDDKSVKIHGEAIIPHFNQPVRISEGGFSGSLKSYIDQSNISYVDGRNFILKSNEVRSNYDISFGILGQLGKGLNISLYKEHFLSLNPDFSDFTNGVEGVSNTFVSASGHDQTRQIVSQSSAPKELSYSFAKDNYDFFMRINNQGDQFIIRFNDNPTLDFVVLSNTLVDLGSNPDVPIRSGEIEKISFITDTFFNFQINKLRAGPRSKQIITFKDGNGLTFTNTISDLINYKQITSNIILPKEFTLPIQLIIQDRTIKFKEMKLELGDYPTEWIAAPEDVNPGFSDFQMYISNMERDIVDNDEEHSRRLRATEESIIGENGVLTRHIETYSNYVTDTAKVHEQILEKTDENGTILRSIVRQEAGSYAISADAINLSGLTTFADLRERNSTTVINGGNITTGTISAARLDLSGYVQVGALESYVTENDLKYQGWTTIHGGNITTGTISSSRIDFDYASGSNVDLSGTITATGGSIGGFNITGTEITSNNSGGYIRLSSHPNAGSRIIVGKSSSNYNFYVTRDGDMYANSGKIGGFNITSSTLSYSGGTSPYGFYLQPGATTSSYKIRANNSSGTRVFSVSGSGALYATGATISGAITATSGSFTGSIYANSGRIGGSNFSKSSNGWVTFDSSISASGVSATNSSFSQSNITKLYIQHNGQMKLVSVDSTGRLRVTT